ncbi:glycoside hydrolase family 15 protein [Pseudonocardia ailaonensis]|uniref:glucan 1,4-alpha-glucosidase n=1 Tax=Pseudonocardia ailaonensis TaxID=367279 RepID=A0ABN2MQP4_9PSEU
MLTFASMRSAVTAPGFDGIARVMYWLMTRNVASRVISYTDPLTGARSLPGAIVASPSFATDGTGDTTQNYVFHWVRDAAIAAAEIAASGSRAGDPLVDLRMAQYAEFAATCQAATDDLATAVFTIDGRPRQGWSLQHDGPALQALMLLGAAERLDGPARDAARGVVERDLAFVVERAHDPATNLWEEVSGQSLFTRAVQLRALRAAPDNALGAAIPAGAPDVEAWLAARIPDHVDGNGRYLSVLDAQLRPDYDPNIDVVLACLHGAIPATDPHLLATVAELRRIWTDPASPFRYPINDIDAAEDLGPLVGRYPGDVYDGDNDPTDTTRDVVGHPWPVCSAALAELHYRVAAAIANDAAPPADDLSRPFFAQVGASGVATSEAVAALCRAGDRILRAIVSHSDHLSLSEQFDKESGFEKSVRELTWSYAAFLSAVRARRRVRPGGGG